MFYGDVGALGVAEKVFSRIYAPVKMIHIAALNGIIRVFAAAPVDEKRIKPFGYLNKIVPCASQRTEFVRHIVNVGVEPEHTGYTRLGDTLNDDIGGAKTPLGTCGL